MKHSVVYVTIEEASSELASARAQLSGLKTAMNEAQRTNAPMELVCAIEEAQDLVLNHIEDVKHQLKRIIRAANHEAEKRAR